MSTLVTLCATEDVEEGAIRQAVLSDGHKLALYRLGEDLFATDDTCTHAEASLSEDGCVVGEKVECGWHYGQFEIRTGRATLWPCTKALRTWPLKIIDGHVHVELPEG